MKHTLVFFITVILVISMTGCKTEDTMEENISVETSIIQQTSAEETYDIIASEPQLDEEIVDPIAEEPQFQIDDIKEYLSGTSQYSDELDQIISAELHKRNVD